MQKIRQVCQSVPTQGRGAATSRQLREASICGIVLPRARPALCNSSKPLGMLSAGLPLIAFGL